MQPIYIHQGDALEAYAHWPSPACIVSDGPYALSGRGGYEGDLTHERALEAWYEPHVDAWTTASTPETSLWFWGSELSWAQVHHLLISYGWQYVQVCTWNKGISHVAGRVNSKTVRSFPVATEVCTLYRRPVYWEKIEGLTTQEWMRHEWKRAGLTLSDANVACGVKNAASRKYLASDHLWYFPPQEHWQSLVKYANKHGKPSDAPYFELPNSFNRDKGFTPVRAKWNHVHGLTNVWDYPRKSSWHPNHKPLDLMERIIQAVTDVGDAVWEPFGGSGSASLASQNIGRSAYYAEIRSEYLTQFQDRATP